MDAKITVEFTSKCVADQFDLDSDFEGSLEKSVRYLIEEEGLLGIVEDDFTIVKVEEL